MDNAPPRRGVQAVKKVCLDFFDSLNHARFSCSRAAQKSSLRSPRPLPRKGSRGIEISFEAGFAPSSSPCVVGVVVGLSRFFDKLKAQAKSLGLFLYVTEGLYLDPKTDHTVLFMRHPLDIA